MQMSPSPVTSANSGSTSGSNAVDSNFASMLETAQGAGTDVSGAGQTPGTSLSGALQIMKVNPNGGSSTDGINRQIMQVNPNGGISANGTNKQIMQVNPNGGSSTDGINKQIMLVNPNGGPSTGGLGNAIMKINPNGGPSTGGIQIVSPPAGGTSLQQLQAMLQSSQSSASALKNFEIDPPSLGDGAGITA